MISFFKYATKFFLCLAVLAPIVLIYSLFFPFINGKVILFRASVELALLCCVAYYLFAHKKIPPRQWRHPIVIAVAVFALAFLITTLTGIHPWSSFWSNFERGEGTFQILHYIAFFFLTTIMFSTKKAWRGLLRWSIVVSMIVLLYGVFQWLNKFGLGGPAIVTGGRVSGTLGNPSYLSAYLLFHFPFLIWLLVTSNQNRWRWLWSGLIIFSALMLLTTETLAAIISFVSSLIFLLLLYTIKMYHHYKERPDNKAFFYWSYASSFLIVGLVFLTVYGLSTVNIYHRLEPRFWTWGSAWQGIQERPLLGWGAESFAEVFDKYSNPKHFGGESWFDRTHNLILEYLVSGGIVLLLAYLAIFAAYYWTLFLLPKDWLWPIFFVIPIAYLMQGFTLFDVLPIYLAWFLFLAFFINYSRQWTLEGAITHTSRSPKWTAWTGTIIVGAGIVALLYYGNYLPLMKNIKIGQALRATSIADVVEKYKVVIALRAPTGDQEAYESIGRSFVIYFESLARQKVIVAADSPGLTAIMNFNENEFAKLKPYVSGIKDYYLYAVWNMAAYRITKHQPFLTKARDILLEAHQKAPHRMEIIVSLFDVSKATGDQALQQEMFHLIQQLRPDLIKQAQ